MGNFARPFWLLQAFVVSFSSGALAVPAGGTTVLENPLGTSTSPPSMGVAPPNGTNGTFSAPPLSRTSSAPVHVQSEIYRYVKDCNKEQKARIETAWKDAKDIAIAHNKWEPSGWFTRGKYQPAQNMYLGTDSSANPWFGKKWYKILQDTMQRQVNIHTDSAPFRTYAFLYCDESKSPAKDSPECGKPNTPGKKVAAYTWDDLGGIFSWSAHHVVLCPRWFDADLDDLQTKIAEAKKNPSMQKVINNFKKNPSRSLFHETYHWKDTIVNPRTKDSTYDPQGVVDLARDKNTAEATLNAESWALAALAVYLQQTFNLKDPPAPGVVASGEDDDLEEHAVDPPPGFVSPLHSNNTFPPGAFNPAPDPTVFTQVGGPRLGNNFG